jgi:hypothetical protein
MSGVAMAPESSSHGLFGAVLDIAAEDTGAAKHSQWCACSRSSLPRPSGRSGYRLFPEEKLTLSSLALYNRANCVLSRVSESYAGEIAIDCYIVRLHRYMRAVVERCWPPKL